MSGAVGPAATRPTTATTVMPESSAAQPRELDVFEQIEAVKERLTAIRKAAERPAVFTITRDEALWLLDRLDAVFAVLADGHVTYGFIDPNNVEAGGTPMLTERDALVRALFTGGHDAKP